METLEEMAREVLSLITSLQKKGVKNETLKKEIDKINDENVRMFFLTGLILTLLPAPVRAGR